MTENAYDCFYLQQQLGDCLSEALAELVSKRPQDPVEFLAKYLYKYREMHPLKGLEEQVSPIATYTEHKPGIALLEESNDDFELFENASRDLNQYNVIVHSSSRTMFLDIGDIFDDEDIT